MAITLVENSKHLLLYQNTCIDSMRVCGSWTRTSEKGLDDRVKRNKYAETAKKNQKGC